MRKLSMVLLAMSAQPEAQANNLIPSYHLSLECNESNILYNEDLFQRFLIKNGFKSINKTKFIKDHGGSTPFSTQIIGLKGKYIVLFEKVGYYNNKYSIIVNIKPPDQAEDQLLYSLDNIASEFEGCTVTHERNAMNQKNSLELFEDLYKIYESWVNKSEFK